MALLADVCWPSSRGIKGQSLQQGSVPALCMHAHDLKFHGSALLAGMRVDHARCIAGVCQARHQLGLLAWAVCRSVLRLCAIRCRYVQLVAHLLNFHASSQGCASATLPRRRGYLYGYSGWASLFTAWELEPQARLARHAQNGFVLRCKGC